MPDVIEKLLHHLQDEDDPENFKLPEDPAALKSLFGEDLAELVQAPPPRGGILEPFGTSCDSSAGRMAWTGAERPRRVNI